MRMLLDRLAAEEPNNIRHIQHLVGRYEWLQERIVTYTDALAQKARVGHDVLTIRRLLSAGDRYR